MNAAPRYGHPYGLFRFWATPEERAADEASAQQLRTSAMEAAGSAPVVGVAAPDLGDLGRVVVDGAALAQLLLRAGYVGEELHRRVAELRIAGAPAVEAAGDPIAQDGLAVGTVEADLDPRPLDAREQRIVSAVEHLYARHAQIVFRVGHGVRSIVEPFGFRQVDGGLLIGDGDYSRFRIVDPRPMSLAAADRTLQRLRLAVKRMREAAQ